MKENMLFIRRICFAYDNPGLNRAPPIHITTHLCHTVLPSVTTSFLQVLISFYERWQTLTQGIRLEATSRPDVMCLNLSHTVISVRALWESYTCGFFRCANLILNRGNG